MGYSWERTKTLTNNRVRWRAPVDALCSFEGEKEWWWWCRVELELTGVVVQCVWALLTRYQKECFKIISSAEKCCEKIKTTSNRILHLIVLCSLGHQLRKEQKKRQFWSRSSKCQFDIPPRCGSLSQATYWAEDAKSSWHSLTLHTYIPWQPYIPAHVPKPNFGYRWEHNFLLIPQSTATFLLVKSTHAHSRRCPKRVHWQWQQSKKYLILLPRHIVAKKLQPKTA